MRATSPRNWINCLFDRQMPTATFRSGRLKLSVDLYFSVCLCCRKVFVVNHELIIDSELGLKPNCGRVSQLSWLTKSTLLATSHEGIQTWQCPGDNTKPCLLLGMSIGLVTAEASPDESTLAAGSRDGVVRISARQPQKILKILKKQTRTHISCRRSFAQMQFQGVLIGLTMPCRVQCCRYCSYHRPNQSVEKSCCGGRRALDGCLTCLLVTGLFMDAHRGGHQCW